MQQPNGRGPFVLSVTSEDAHAFWAYMGAQTGGRVVDKRTAPEMQVIAEALGAAGLLTPEVFLEEYATTIGRTIYVSDLDALPPWDSILLAVHEHQHVIQYGARGPGFAWRYLSEPAYRTSAEVEAMRAAMEVDYVRRGATRAPRELAAGLRSYAVSPADVRTAERMLEQARVILGRGAPPTVEAARLAYPWLRSRSLVQ